MSEALGRTGRRGWSARAACLVLAGQLGFSIAQITSMLLSREVWLADLANFIRPHLLIAGLVLFVVGIALPHRSTKMGGIAALAAAAMPYLMLPAPAQPGEGQPITLVSANLLIDNTEIERFLAIPDVVSADILVLQEVRPQWQEALSATGLWPYESSRDLPANSDMKVFSRFPITGEQTVAAQSADTGGRHALRLELAVGARPLALYAMHPQTPRRRLMWRERTAYLRDVAAALRAEPAAATVVAGDWNTPAWSPFFRQLLDATGYRTTESRWWPAPTRFAVRFGGITWLGTPIDRVVVSPAVGLTGLTTGPRFGSNHLPVIARLTIPD